MFLNWILESLPDDNAAFNASQCRFLEHPWQKTVKNFNWGTVLNSPTRICHLLKRFDGGEFFIFFSI